MPHPVSWCRDTWGYTDIKQHTRETSGQPSGHKGEVWTNGCPSALVDRSCWVLECYIWVGLRYNSVFWSHQILWGYLYRATSEPLGGERTRGQGSRPSFNRYNFPCLCFTHQILWKRLWCFKQKNKNFKPLIWYSLILQMKWGPQQSSDLVKNQRSSK